MTNARRIALAVGVGVADSNPATSSTRGLTEYEDLCTRQCAMSTNGCIVSSAHSALLLQGTPLGDLMNKMNQCHDRSIPNPHFEVADQTKCESGDSDCVWNVASSSCEPDTGWLLHEMSTRLDLDGSHCALLGDHLEAGGYCRIHNTEQRCTFEGYHDATVSCAWYPDRQVCDVSEARMAELIEANSETFESVAQRRNLCESKSSVSDCMAIQNCRWQDNACTVGVLEAIISITSGESCPFAAVLQRHMQCAEKSESDCVSIPEEGFYDCVWSAGVCQAHALAVEQDLLDAYEFPEQVTMGFSRAQAECTALDDSPCRQLCSLEIIFPNQDSYSVRTTIVVPSILLIVSAYFL